MILLLGVVVVGMFFMSSRQRKQQATQTSFRDSLVPGQEVMTSSGQLGTVVSTDENSITLETTPGVYTRWVKAAIQAIPPQFAAAAPSAVEEESAYGEASYGEPEYGAIEDDNSERPGDDPRNDRPLG